MGCLLIVAEIFYATFGS